VEMCVTQRGPTFARPRKPAPARDQRISPQCDATRLFLNPDYRSKAKRETECRGNCVQLLPAPKRFWDSWIYSLGRRSYLCCHSGRSLAAKKVHWPTVKEKSSWSVTASASISFNFKKGSSCRVEPMAEIAAAARPARRRMIESSVPSARPHPGISAHVDGPGL